MLPILLQMELAERRERLLQKIADNFTNDLRFHISCIINDMNTITFLLHQHLMIFFSSAIIIQ